MLKNTNLNFFAIALAYNTNKHLYLFINRCHSIEKALQCLMLFKAVLRLLTMAEVLLQNINVRSEFRECIRGTLK